MKIKRIVAFLIDIFIVSMLSSFVVLIPVFNYDAEKQNDIMEEYVEKVKIIGSGELDEEEIMSVMYNYASAGLTVNIISTTMMFIYFGIFGFFNNGNTIGKKIMKIKVVPLKGEDLNPSLYVLREILLLGIAFKILGILVTLLIQDVGTWYSAYNIINNLSMLVSFIIYGFIVFRDDERGLHDLVGKTKVISAKEQIVI